MKSRGLFALLLGVLIVGMMSGCKSWRRGRGADLEPGNAGVVVDPEFGIQDIGMGDERIEGAPLAMKFEPVYFDYDSSQVKSSERSKIEKVAEYLRTNSRLRLIVEGHCDERGSAEYNLALGERRALAIRAYLTGLGIDPRIIQTVSYGEERPAAEGSGESVWRLNRRGEFAVME